MRHFGLVALLFFGLLGTVAFWQDKTILACFLWTLATLGLGFLVLPRPLAPVYQAWLKGAHIISTAFTTVLLTLSYFLVITPAALMLRLLRKRLLPLKPDLALTTYWISRSEPAQRRERFTKRF
jgi:hypothetical protein